MSNFEKKFGIEKNPKFDKKPETEIMEIRKNSKLEKKIWDWIKKSEIGKIRDWKKNPKLWEI